ncbi:MAG: hypothetical protein WCG36_03645 [bacterium]
MFEHHHQPLASLPAFIKRMAACLFISQGLAVVALSMGMVGYHQIAGLAWIDSFENAAMILGGMGPVDQMATTAAKLFAGLYAIFCGLMFITIMGIVMAPILHRVMHRFHLADEDVNSAS